MDERDRKVLAKIADLLEPVETYSLRVDALDHPKRGSPAKQSAKYTFGNLHTTFATSSLASAVDHARTWSLIIQGRAIPIGGYWSLIRGAMEGAATCRWLIDPKVDFQERIRRGAVMQLDDWRQRERFERSLGVGPDSPRDPKARWGFERVAETEAKMRRIGMIAQDVKGRDVKPLSTTDRVQAYANESMWRAASAFAHSSPWSMMLLQQDSKERFMNLEGSKRVLVSAGLEYAWYATVPALECIRLGLGELEAHYGR
jgi:hypothetical protein